MKKAIDEVARFVSDEEWIQRAEMINEAIDRWTKRPRPELHFSDLPIRKPVRRSFEYYAGRFYDTSEVFSSLSELFGEGEWSSIIRKAHLYVYGSVLTIRAAAHLDQMIESYKNGGQLPPFVLAAYVELRSEA